jgi:NAD+ synthase
MTPPEIVTDKDTILQMAERIIQATVEYVEDSGLKSLILGVSGGIDSTLVAILASEVCKRLDNKVMLIGRSIPIHSKYQERVRAFNIGSRFCDERTFKVIDLSDLYEIMISKLYFTKADATIESKIRRGNIKARLRMIQLFHAAHENNGMVLSTDNFTEYLLGFWTLHGDVGNYGMIQHLWKTEVYEMAKHIHEIIPIHSPNTRYIIQECIDAVPTDGLGITDSDLDQFGEGIESYQQVDELLFQYLSGNLLGIVPDVIELHERTYFKRQDPINIPRHIIMGEES